MRDLSTTLLDASVKQMQNDKPYLTLVEVVVPSTPETVFRLANCDRDIRYGSTTAGVAITWQRFNIAVGDFRETKSGDLPQLQVGLVDIGLEMRALLHQYRGLRGSRVRIYTLNAGALADTKANLLHVGEVLEAEADERSILFTLGHPSLNDASFPARRYLTRCSVSRFGDSDCGYSIPISPTNAVGGGFSFCRRSLDDCGERGDDEAARGLTVLHPRLMDGFPGIAPGND